MAASLEEIVQRQETEQTFYKVNVAMTCYNQKDCIGKAIDSVLAQKTDFPYLIVIGDDASTDGSMELLREYERRFPEKIKVIRQEKNKGINENRRTVFAGCEAPYIAMLDGDDFYTDEEQLQRKFDFLTENHDYIGYFTGGGYQKKDGTISEQTDFEKRQCFHLFSREEALTNAYPGIQDGFFFRNIFRYEPRDFIACYGKVEVDHSSTLPIVLGMLGKIYRNDHRMTYVYRDVAGSDSKRGNCKRYYISRIALQRMVYELYGEKMQVEDQIKTLVWDALIGALKARSGKERRERWAEWTYIWNDGYFSHGQICRFLGKKMREKLTGAIKGRKV